MHDPQTYITFADGFGMIPHTYLVLTLPLHVLGRASFGSSSLHGALHGFIEDLEFGIRSTGFHELNLFLMLTAMSENLVTREGFFKKARAGHPKAGSRPLALFRGFSILKCMNID